MRTEREIRNQLDKMMEEHSRMHDAHEDGTQEYENLCNQMDALLWVIGDISGAPIWGEVR